MTEVTAEATADCAKLAQQPELHFDFQSCTVSMDATVTWLLLTASVNWS